MKIPNNETQIRSLDLEHLFDTLDDYVRLNPERRKALRVSVQSKNMIRFAVDAFDKSCRVVTDVEA
jgi:hypothetical protein